MSCQFTCNRFSLSSVAWLVNSDTMRRGTHSSGGVVGTPRLLDGAPLGEQIYVLEGKKRISGGSHQRSDNGNVR